MGPQNLLERSQELRNRMATAARACGRSVDSVTLLAVTKGHDAQAVRAAVDAGIRDFGESYLQEALGKMAALEELPVSWHFIGRLQANKTRPVAERFAWVHAVDRLKIAERLSDQRPYYAPPLNVCLQVNIAGEDSKGGVTPQLLPELAREVAQLPRLKLRGLMCLPPEESDPARQRMWFARLREAFTALNRLDAGLDTLSMGMSGDFEAAILEGSTLIRLGTALFGARTPRASAP